MAGEREKTRYFHSYRSLFRINYKIYDIGGKVLPRAIPLDALFLTLALYFPCLPLGWLLSSGHPWFTAWLPAGTAAWLVSQADPQGKFLPVFVWDFLAYLFRPKTANLAGRPVHRMRRRRLNWYAMEVVDEVSTDSLQKQHRF